MTIPTYDQLIFPLLNTLGQYSEGLRVRDVREKIAAELSLSSEDRAVLLPSGVQPVFNNRVGWAHDRLKRERLSSSPSRGFWKITPAGQEYLSQHPDGIDAAEIRRIALVPHVPASTRGIDGQTGTTSDETDEQVTRAAPDERIDEAIQDLHSSVSSELLTNILASPPEFFERLVLDLLVKMGYGTDDLMAEQIGGSGDGGLDGVIALDRLGLEKVYIQAKRWQDSVGRPLIQAFFGALAGRRASKGVFITTSRFTSDARAYASQVSGSLVLVDGDMLTKLMIEHEVGVSVQRTVKIVRVDSDYFEDE